MTLKEKYTKEAMPALMEKFGYKNKMAIPRIVKVVINCGFGRMISGKGNDEQKKIYEAIVADLAAIAGQKPALRKTNKSIATFKTRQGMYLGAAVVLRKKKMFDFLERFIGTALPRMRDFQGINPDSFDKGGNLTYGVKEHIIFPEILPEKVKNIFGFEITVVTTAKTKEEGRELLRLLGFPFKHEQ